MGAVGTAGMGAVGIVGFAVALDSLGMSVIVIRTTCRVSKRVR